jgi:cytochrome c5
MANSNDSLPTTTRSWRLPVAAAMLALLVLAGALAARFASRSHPAQERAAGTSAQARGKLTLAAAGPEASKAEVDRFCGDCHASPPPESLPRSEWRQRVLNGYKFLKEYDRELVPPPAPAEQVIRYYEARSPVDMPLLKVADAPGAAPVRLSRSGYPAPNQNFPRVTNVNLVPLLHPTRPDLLVCDARYHQVVALRPYVPPGKNRARVLAKIPAPAHTEVADLNKDGIRDVLVADLGDVFPSDHTQGRVVWLRGAPNGTFTPVTLLKNVGRVTDVQAADFDGDGDLDLIVAIFGWRHVGSVTFLENRTTNWSRPVFVPHIVDKRPGAIHVPVTDLNHDGRPDFVALFAQEYEVVEAFLNTGGGKFRKQTIFSAGDPSYGSSGIQLVDMDKDGDEDVLYTNGDVFDFSFLRPDNSIQWLENKGGFPFVRHHITNFYGVHRAQAVDMDGDGDKDVVAVAFLPEANFPQRAELDLDSAILMEQTAPNRWARHSLGTVSADHPTCVAGDLNADGRPDLVAGNFWVATPDPLDTVTVWINGAFPARPQQVTRR